MYSQYAWEGSTICDICLEDCSDKGKHLFDTPTILGVWAVTCDKCHERYGYMKLGQVYDATTLVKIANLEDI
jgi:hypothetical protein